MASRSFQAFHEIWNRALIGNMDAVIGKIIGDNAAVLAVIGALAVAVLGWVMANRSDGSWAKAAIIRIAAISFLMTVANFNQFIREPILNDVPNFIAATALGGDNGGNAPTRFDQIVDVIEAKKAEIFQEASGWLDLDARLYTSVVVGCGLAILWVSFVIWMFAGMTLGLLVYAAPFLLGFYLFDATRHITLGWKNTVISTLIMMLLVSLVVRISVEGMFNLARDYTAGGRGIFVQIAILENTVGFFFGSLCLIGAACWIAARIGGGVAPTVFSNVGTVGR